MNSLMASRPERSEKAPKVGIVHLGLGAFFRAHGAQYIQRAMELSGGNPGSWGVLGVSLRSPNVRDALVPQDCVFTAVETSGTTFKPNRVTVVTDVLVAPENPQAVLDGLTAEDVKLVTLTITEKGYCRGQGDTALDLDHPDIRHDVAHPLPKSAPGFIVRALQQRRELGRRPFTVMPLDNLPNNGSLTRRIILEFAEQIDAELSEWISQEVCFPSTMVDRIVPATTPQMLERLRSEHGIDDPAAVFHEPFCQWVIEDRFVDNVRPDFGQAGALLVQDVEPYEHMKLRMLNGTHSALAYVGSLVGHETVYDAISDPGIAEFVSDLWSKELSVSLTAPEGVDLKVYADDLRARYENPEIRHLLEQIAMDGSQKLPQRILDALFENREAGRPYHRLLMVLAAWMRFLQIRAATGSINDPLSVELEQAVDVGGDVQLVRNVFGITAVFGGYPVDGIQQDVEEALKVMAMDMSSSVLNS